MKKKILYAVEKIEGDSNSYLPKEYTYNYCIENDIPYVLINFKSELAYISFDMISIDYGLTFPDSHQFSETWSNYVEKYHMEKEIPPDKPYYVGGERNGGFYVWKKDYKEIVEELIKQIDAHVKKYGTIDLVRREYHELITLKNKIQFGTEEWSKLDKRLREVVDEMNKKE